MIRLEPSFIPGSVSFIEAGTEALQAMQRAHVSWHVGTQLGLMGGIPIFFCRPKSCGVKVEVTFLRGPQYVRTFFSNT